MAARVGAVAAMADGRVVVTGGLSSPSAETLATVAYAPGGAVEWMQTLGAPATAIHGVALACDGDRVYVGAERYGPTAREGVLLCYRSSATASVPGVAGAGSVTAAPNPFRATTRFAYAAASGARVALDVFDAAGRRVRTLAGGTAPAAGAIDWDGRDDFGRTVAPGVYPYRLAVGDRAATGRVLRLR
jgi:hypothetical protein